jgi:hypothetical protein
VFQNANIMPDKGDHDLSNPHDANNGLYLFTLINIHHFLCKQTLPVNTGAFHPIFCILAVRFLLQISLSTPRLRRLLGTTSVAMTTSWMIWKMAYCVATSRGLHQSACC